MTDMEIVLKQDDHAVCSLDKALSSASLKSFYFDQDKTKKPQNKANIQYIFLQIYNFHLRSIKDKTYEKGTEKEDSRYESLYKYDSLT
jgi:hypothetical protein